MPNKTDKENLSISIPPSFIRILDEYASQRYVSRNKIVFDAIRRWILEQCLAEMDTPETWDRYYQDNFEDTT